MPKEKEKEYGRQRLDSVTKTIRVDYDVYKRLVDRARWGKPLTEAIEDALNKADEFDLKKMVQMTAVKGIQQTQIEKTVTTDNANT